MTPKTEQDNDGKWIAKIYIYVRPGGSEIIECVFDSLFNSERSARNYLNKVLAARGLTHDKELTGQERALSICNSLHKAANKISFVELS